MSVPAIVGAFPEPMVHGLKGKRFPVRVECENEQGAACLETKRRLGGAGVKTSSSALGADATRNVLRVIVARWPEPTLVQAAAPLAKGPNESGVFARFSGHRLQLLDERGRVARTAQPDTGLVAALRPDPEKILWVVTGVDERGVERAAQSLNARALTDAFAVAATPGGPKDLPLR